MSAFHTPVLVQEVLEYLGPRPGMLAVDGTVGGGGHARALLERIAPAGRLIGIDRDEEALREAARELTEFGDRVTLVHGRFDRLAELVGGAGVEPQTVDCVLLDLGVSSWQLDTTERGFSFSRPGPLDMRMDPSSGRTAADLLHEASEGELTECFFRWGEERWSKRIARRIVEVRTRRPLRMTDELAEVIAGAVPRSAWPHGIHPATRVFQALRIAVNEELLQVGMAIRQGAELLKRGGRMAVISFHSLEDRIVKTEFVRLAGACTCPPALPVCACGAISLVKVLSRKPVTASSEEIGENPRSRSAKLRVVERL